MPVMIYSGDIPFWSKTLKLKTKNSVLTQLCERGGGDRYVEEDMQKRC